jgi:uncharacterized protein (TIRG00374 family)
MKKQTMVLGIILICGIALIVLVYKNRQIITKTIDYIFGKIAPTIAPKVSNIFTNLIAGMVAIHNVSDFFKIISLSILSWFVQILMVYITAKSLDISIDIIASSIVLAIINVGLLIPLAPGNVGTFQVFCIIALSLFSVTKSKALSFSIIFQVIQGIPVIIGGSVSLFKQIIISRHTKMVSSDMKKEDQRGLII